MSFIQSICLLFSRMELFQFLAQLSDFIAFLLDLSTSGFDG